MYQYDDEHLSKRIEKMEGRIVEQQPGSPRSGNTPEQRNAIAAAALARIEEQKKREAANAVANKLDKERFNHEQKIRRLIKEVAGSISYEKAHACLQLLHTLFNNIIENPNENKYRSFKSNQPKIVRDIFSVQNADSFLVENGFRTRTFNFQQDWFIPDSDQWPKDCLGMKRIAWSRNLIGERMREYAENAERQKEKEQSEKLVEKSRKARALAEAQEDRERVALRTQRERKARIAQAEAEAQMHENVEEENHFPDYD